MEPYPVMASDDRIAAVVRTSYDFVLESLNGETNSITRRPARPGDSMNESSAWESVLQRDPTADDRFLYG